MRKLITHDAFLACRVIHEIGVKDELVSMANAIRNRGESEKSQEEIGLELIMGVLANAGTERAEMAVYTFLEGPLEIPAAELKQMDLLKFMSTIKEYIGFIDLEEWRDFFHYVGKIQQLSST